MKISNSDLHGSEISLGSVGGVSLAFLVSAVDVGKNPSQLFPPFLLSCGHCTVQMMGHEVCKAKICFSVHSTNDVTC